jgi:hypothetical protein
MFIHATVWPTMRETILQDFFLRRITPSVLAEDVSGSTKRVTSVESVVEIEDMQGNFSVTREMLISLCDAALSGHLPPADLAAIGFALKASHAFEWDDDLMSEVISDWSCPEINYPLTQENVQRFRDWLSGTEAYPTRSQPKKSTESERLVSVRRKMKLGGGTQQG